MFDIYDYFRCSSNSKLIVGFRSLEGLASTSAQNIICRECKSVNTTKMGFERPGKKRGIEFIHPDYLNEGTSEDSWVLNYLQNNSQIK